MDSGQLPENRRVHFEDGTAPGEATPSGTTEPAVGIGGHVWNAVTAPVGWAKGADNAVGSAYNTAGSAVGAVRQGYHVYNRAMEWKALAETDEGRQELIQLFKDHVITDDNKAHVVDLLEQGRTHVTSEEFIAQMDPYKEQIKAYLMEQAKEIAQTQLENFKGLFQTEEGRAQLTGILKQIMSEQNKEMFTQFVNEMYGQVTSADMEIQFNDWFKQVYAEEGIEIRETMAPGELEQLHAELGERGVRAATGISDYALKFVDDYAHDFCIKNPGTRIFVVDLGNSEALQQGEPQKNGFRFMRSTRQMKAEIKEGKYVYLYGSDPVTGRAIWIRRERDKVKPEFEAALKIGFNNIRKTIGKRHEDTGGTFAVDMMAEAFHGLAGHFNRFADHVEAGGLSEEVRQQYQHRHLRAAQEEIHERARANHGHELGGILYEEAFPNGAADIPVMAMYKPVLDMVLPQVLGLVSTEINRAMTSPDTINKLMLQIVKSLPKPDEMTTGDNPGDLWPDVDPALKRDAGELLITVLGLASPQFESLYNKLIRGLDIVGQDVFSRNVQDSLGDLLGGFIVQWLDQFKDPDDLFGYLMDTLDENFTQPSLTDDDPVTAEAKKRAERAELERELTDTLANFVPYLTTTVTTVVVETAKNVARGAEGVVGLRAHPEERAVPEELSALRKAWRAVTGALGKLFGAILRVLKLVMSGTANAFMHFTHIDEYMAQRRRREAERQAEVFIQLMNSSYHERWGHEMMDLVVYRTVDQPIPVE